MVQIVVNIAKVVLFWYTVEKSETNAPKIINFYCEPAYAAVFMREKCQNEKKATDRVQHKTIYAIPGF